MSIITIDLNTYAYGGEVIGRDSEGRAVFVPYAMPGERVRVRLGEEKKGFARGELVEVVKFSLDRVDPRCSHFMECGGCHYQHIPYDIQLNAKVDILRDTLNRIGKQENPPLAPIVPSTTPWNYRNNVQFHLTPDGELGYQHPGSNTVFAIKECFLPVLSIGEIWPQLDMEVIPGLDRIGLRVGDNDDAILILESSDPQPIEISVDLPISIIHSGPAGQLVLAGDDHIIITVLDRSFKVSAESFFQINPLMAGKMVEYIANYLRDLTVSTLVDAFCGVGLFSAFLAPHVDRLIGIETSQSACDDFVFNLDEYDNVELYEAPVADVLSTFDMNLDALIVDPPRGGLDIKTIDEISRLQPHTLIYVSCNPATLSRDIYRLSKGGYSLRQTTPFDLFPQTYHIESISIFEK